MSSDPWSVLGLSPGATDTEITQAYRKLARKYHPDINHGNPDAAKKMSELNAAYDQVKNGGSAGRAQQAESGGYYNSTQGFGFDPFEEFFGGRSAGAGRAGDFSEIRNFINSGRWADALSALNYRSNRTAEWYYYSAVVNSNLGNSITALQHAKTAVRMEPDNAEYRRILEQIQGGAQAYSRRSSEYGMPEVNLNRICLGVMLTNLFCFCCRPF